MKKHWHLLYFMWLSTNVADIPFNCKLPIARIAIQNVKVGFNEKLNQLVAAVRRFVL